MKKNRKLTIYEGNDAVGKTHLVEQEYNQSDKLHTRFFYTPYIARDVIKNDTTISDFARQLVSSASHFDLIKVYDKWSDCNVIQDRTFISSLVYILTARYDNIDDIKIAFRNDSDIVLLRNLYSNLITQLFDRFDIIEIKYIMKSKPVGRIYDETDKDVFSGDIDLWKLRNETYLYVLDNYINDFDIKFIDNDFE